MSEQQEQQPVILTIDDQEYDVNELGNDTKVHYVQVVNLRKQLADLQNQIAAAQQQSINLQVALGFRENALRESIQVVEEPRSRSGELMAETHASKALKKIEIHEAECALRYDAINKRLDSGSARFDKLEKMIWGIYPVMIASLIAIVGLVIAQ
jgi:chaperonin cofactor prefoldin